jgi:hypothetical protein
MQVIHVISHIINSISLYMQVMHIIVSVGGFGIEFDKVNVFKPSRQSRAIQNDILNWWQNPQSQLVSFTFNLLTFVGYPSSFERHSSAEDLSFFQAAT